MVWGLPGAEVMSFYLTARAGLGFWGWGFSSHETIYELFLHVNF